VKILLGTGSSLLGRLLLYDALAMEFTEFRLRKDPACPVCGDEPSVTELIDYEGFCGMPAVGEAEVEVPALSAAELKARMARGEDLLLLDVREPEEFERARIEGARLIPLGELPARMGELADWKERAIVVQCHTGVRSERACRSLLEQGFTRVENLDGGIEAWSVTVDFRVPRY
jgi:adenylyltransferase/sulfurtransferase